VVQIDQPLGNRKLVPVLPPERLARLSRLLINLAELMTLPTRLTNEGLYWFVGVPA